MSARPADASGPSAAAQGGAGTAGGAALVVFAACAFGSISTLVVIATRAGAGGGAAPSLATVLAWRYLLAGLLLLPLAVRERRRTGRGVPTTPRALLAGVAGAGIGQMAVAGLSLSSLRWIPVGTLGFLFYTFPSWVTLLAAVRGTERLDGRKLAALALSFAGIACTIGLPGGGAAAGAGSAWPGIALALGAAVAYAFYIPYLGRLQAETSPTAASLLLCVGAALGFALGSGRELLVAKPPAFWGAVAVLSLVCSVLAFLAFMRGLGRLGPVRTAIVSTVEPLFTAGLGAVALGQPVGPATVAGGALIAAAVGLLQLPPRRPHPAPP